MEVKNFTSPAAGLFIERREEEKRTYTPRRDVCAVVDFMTPNERESALTLFLFEKQSCSA